MKTTRLLLIGSTALGLIVLSGCVSQKESMIK